MDTSLIQVIIQGGAVGIAGYAIYSLKQIISNHISHNTEALSKLTEAIAKLTQLLDDKLR